VDDALAALVTRQEIMDCLRRYTRGMDRLDPDLIASAFHDDAVICFGDDVKTRQQLVDYAVTSTEVTEARQHYNMNHEIDIDGDAAHCESYYLAVVKLKAGGAASIPNLERKESAETDITIYGGRYVDRLEKRAGEWRVALRWSVPEWAIQGALYMPGFVAAAAGGKIGRRDNEDPAYERPLQGPAVPGPLAE